jgi:hypothetical protein
VIQGAELTPAGDKSAEQFAVLLDRNTPHRLRDDEHHLLYAHLRF